MCNLHAWTPIPVRSTSQPPKGQLISVPLFNLKDFFYFGMFEEKVTKPQCRPKKIIILIMGTTKNSNVPQCTPNFGKLPNGDPLDQEDPVQLRY